MSLILTLLTYFSQNNPKPINCHLFQSCITIYATPPTTDISAIQAKTRPTRRPMFSPDEEEGTGAGERGVGSVPVAVRSTLIFFPRFKADV